MELFFGFSELFSRRPTRSYSIRLSSTAHFPIRRLGRGSPWSSLLTFAIKSSYAGVYHVGMFSEFVGKQIRTSRRRALVTMLSVCAAVHLAVAMVTLHRMDTNTVAYASNSKRNIIFSGDVVQPSQVSITSEIFSNSGVIWEDTIETKDVRRQRSDASEVHSTGAALPGFAVLWHLFRTLPTRMFSSQNNTPLIVDSTERERRRQLKLGKKQQEVRRWVKTRRHKHCVKVKKQIQELKDLDAFVPIFHHAPCVLPPGTNY